MDGNMKRPYFSMIVPVYNSAKYLKKAIESIQNQSFTDWELILVENASTDESLSICQEYSASDERIRTLHEEENQGANGARATGVSLALGRYITFMDSDDYVDDNLFADVYQVLEANPAKLVVLGALEEYYDAQGQITGTKKVSAIGEREDALFYADADLSGDGMRVLFLKEEKKLHEKILDLEKRTLYGYLWNKFYDAEYLKQGAFAFHRQTLLEDARFNTEYAQDIDTMDVIDIACYHYCKRQEPSLTSKVISDYFPIHQKHVKMLWEQQKTWGRDDRKTRQILGDIYVRYIASALERNERPDANMDKQSKKQWLKELFADDLYEDLLVYAKGQGAYMELVAGALQAKSVFRCLLFGRLIYIVRAKMPGVFAKLRRR